MKHVQILMSFKVQILQQVLKQVLQGDPHFLDQKYTGLLR